MHIDVLYPKKKFATVAFRAIAFYAEFKVVACCNLILGSPLFGLENVPVPEEK